MSIKAHPVGPAAGPACANTGGPAGLWTRTRRWIPALPLALLSACGGQAPAPEPEPVPPSSAPGLQKPAVLATR